MNLITLFVVKMVGALSLQFIKAPHYVDFTHNEAGYTVIFHSGARPALTQVSTKKNDKVHTTLTLTVPVNGGLKDVFGCGFGDDDAAAAAAGGAIRNALKAYEESQTLEQKPAVL